MIYISYKDDVNLYVDCSNEGDAEDLREFFSFRPKGYQWSPKYKAKLWDGFIRLYNPYKRTLAIGLIDLVLSWAKRNDIPVELEDRVQSLFQNKDPGIEKYIDGLELFHSGKKIELWPHQRNAVLGCLKRNRATLESPTACLSGDTMIDGVSFEELYDAYNNGKKISLPTPHGYKRVIGAYKKFGPGVKITFNDNTTLTGSNYHLMMSGGEFKPLISFKMGDTATNALLEEEKIIIAIDAVHEQNWFDFSLDYEHESYIQNNTIHHNSGKSLILYCMIKYYLNRDPINTKILLIVPSVALIHQMADEFDGYGNCDFPVHKIFAGQDKNTNKSVTISTYQSLAKVSKKYLSQFNVCFVDECHTSKNNTISTLLAKMDNCPIKTGMTGTLDDCEMNGLTIQGLFGPVLNFVTNKELMDAGTSAKIKIRNILLKYPDSICKASATLDYKSELKLIIEDSVRNNTVANLIITQKKNSLTLANNISHIKALERACKKKAPNRKVYVITGSVKAEVREKIRKEAENEKDCIIIATYGVLAVGWSMKNLHSVIFASPTKSKIRTLQSIGRGLRTNSEKSSVVLYDIVDDLTWKKHKNYAIQHFISRMAMYNKEKFDYTMHRIKL